MYRGWHYFVRSKMCAEMFVKLAVFVLIFQSLRCDRFRFDPPVHFFPRRFSPVFFIFFFFRQLSSSGLWKLHVLLPLPRPPSLALLILVISPLPPQSALNKIPTIFFPLRFLPHIKDPQSFVPRLPNNSLISSQTTHWALKMSCRQPYRLAQQQALRGHSLYCLPVWFWNFI